MLGEEDFSPSKSWDWAYLYYVGTVMLGMSEKAFWSCTPRKLHALSEVHIEVNAGGKKGNKQQYGFIDQVI